MRRPLIGLTVLLAAAALAVAGWSWRAAGVAAAGPEGQTPSALDARIQIVWPHDTAGRPAAVGEATLANVTVYLFERGTRIPFCDAGNAGFFLTVAANNGVPSTLGSAGVPRRVTQGGVTFVAWDFNDVDVSLARDPRSRLYLATLDFVVLATRPIAGSIPVQSNVWAHGVDALTFFPTQDVPTGTAPAPAPGAQPQLDPKIEIVWPHDRQGRPADVGQASLANVTVAVFHHGTLTSVTPDYDEPVQLRQALNQEPLRPVATGRKRVVTAGGVTYPVWDFDGVDVSAARDPRNRYFFQAETRSDFSNVWVHGSDGRSFFPVQDTPERGCP